MCYSNISIEFCKGEKKLCPCMYNAYSIKRDFRFWLKLVIINYST